MSRIEAIEFIHEEGELTARERAEELLHHLAACAAEDARESGKDAGAAFGEWMGRAAYALAAANLTYGVKGAEHIAAKGITVRTQVDPEKLVPLMLPFKGHDGRLAGSLQRMVPERLVPELVARLTS